MTLTPEFRDTADASEVILSEDLPLKPSSSRTVLKNATTTRVSRSSPRRRSRASQMKNNSAPETPIQPRRQSKRVRSLVDSATKNLPAVVTPPPGVAKKESDHENDNDGSTTTSNGFLAKRKKSSTKTNNNVVVKPPQDWEEIYSLVEELRQDRTAPCDHSGAEALAGDESTTSPPDRRFRALLALMLSSQTKDAVVGEAMRSMEQANVLTVPVMAQLPPDQLHGYIQKVGFHNNKLKYIRETVQILLSEYNGDVPPTAAEMMKLPGVGPKMAYICESICWNQQSGIGVDTHMHRLFNQLKWVKNTKTPEQTRVQLEAWLPKEKWSHVNLLWVGFGQEIQQFQSKILRKALDCSRPPEALALLKRCGMDVIKEAKKAEIEDEVRQELQKNIN